MIGVACDNRIEVGSRGAGNLEIILKIIPRQQFRPFKIPAIYRTNLKRVETGLDGLLRHFQTN